MASVAALPDSPSPEGAPVSSAHDVRTALRNGVKLGLSLMGTWAVALVVRFFLPRYLGPERFGLYSFSDAFAATYFVFLGLGIDAYIQKEIPARPRHASDFLGGVLMFRLLLSAALLGALSATLAMTGRSGTAQALVFVFGTAQMLVTLNATLSAILQANTTVGGLAALNVTTKIAWGVGVGLGIHAGVGLMPLAVCFLVSEAVKAIGLFVLVRRETGLVLRLDVRQGRTVLAASIPFYVNAVAIALCSKLDVTMLSFLTHNDDKQVGWYSASSNLASLSMLLSPLLGWVVMPLLSRAKHRSLEDFWAIVRRAVEWLQVVTLPLTLFMALGADLWIRIVFGSAYAPAAGSLRMLAPLFMFTYLAVLLSMTLVILDRAWELTMVSFIGLMVNPLLACALVPWCAHHLGDGGGGIGTALGVLGMEIVTAGLLFMKAGRQVFDARSLSVIGRTLFACAAVTAIHVLLVPLGHVRLLIDAGAYVAIAVGIGALRLTDVRQGIRLLRPARA